MTVSGTLVEPAFFTHPAWSRTLGSEVADLCELAGRTPDPEQRLALDAIFALGPANKAVAFETAIIAPRQNIKSSLFEECVLGWLFVTDQRLIVWSAHEFSTSQEAHRNLTELIEGCDPLRKRIKGIYRGNGDESIELLTGQRVKFKARTKTGGRGLSGDKVVLDEAFALQPVHMGSLFPLMSVRPDPQVLYGSSAGLEQSGVLRGIRDRGRAGGDPGLVYLEWCDDLPGECATASCDHNLSAVGCRLDDRARWQRANTQLGRRMSVEYVAAERRALPPHEFGRERLGDWDADPAVGGVFEGGHWADCTDPSSQLVGLPTFAVDITTDRSTAAVGAAGLRSDGLQHLEVVESGRGADWVVPFLLKATAKNGGSVVVDPASPAGTLVGELERAGIRVHLMSARDYAAACGQLYDDVRDGRIRHISQPELDTAVNGARKRDLAGGFAWDRKTVDISPLVAVTLAGWGARTFGADLAESVW